MQPMRLVTVKGRELAPSAATKAGAGGGHESWRRRRPRTCTGGRQRGRTGYPQTGTGAGTRGWEARRPRSRCQFCDRLECRFYQRPSASRRCACYRGQASTSSRRSSGHLRRRCREGAGSGLAFGVCCVGSSIGLMAMLVVLGVMSVGWMAVIAVLVTAQKLLPPRAALDVPLALPIVAFWVLIIVDPSPVPGPTAPMQVHSAPPLPLYPPG